MKVLDRYVLREFLLPLGAALLLFVFALAMDRVFALLDLVLNRGIAPWTVLRLMACLLPSIAAVALPMASLLAALLSFGRLAHDRELLAMKGAGLSLVRLSASVAGAGLVFACCMVAFNGTVLPRANIEYKEIFFSMVRTQASIAFKERLFIREFDRYLLYFDRKEEPGGVLRDVYIVEDMPAAPPRLVSARRGRVEIDPHGMEVKLVLEDGCIEQPADTAGQRITRVDFGSYELNLAIREALGDVRFFARGASEMTYADLLAKMREVRNVPAQLVTYQIEFHKRTAFAFAVFFVILTGVPLGSLARRGGGVGMLIGLGVIFVYYFLLTMGQGWASRGVLSPWAGLWMPNLVLLVFGCAAFLVARHEVRWMRWGR